MKFLILGANGSMGQRYQAILKHLGRDFICKDKEVTDQEMVSLANSVDGVILATPTETHTEQLTTLIELTKTPILCEKPVTKNLVELKVLFEKMNQKETHFTMMMQYKMLDHGGAGHSYYDYFRTGKDGLVWDCFQIIALAKWSVEINNQSPVWECYLNSKRLSLGQMDQAYVDFVDQWTRSRGDDLDELYRMHEKVRIFEIGLRE